MSYQDKLISELEEESELLMQIDGKILEMEEEIYLIKASVIYSIKHGVDFDSDEIHPFIRYIIKDLIKNPYTTRFNFFMYCLRNETEDEVYRTYNLLLSGTSYQEMAEISPLFKDFLFSNPSNQE